MLPKAELEAVLEGEMIEYCLKPFCGLSLLESDAQDSGFLKRLAYTLEAWELLGVEDSLQKLSGKIYDQVGDCETFRISAKKKIAQKSGGILTKLGMKVNLCSADVDILVFEYDGRYVAGSKIGLFRDFERRKAQYRPYFHPTSMHPKLARCLVNLARLRQGQSVIDPFCGTGGILIEAGMCGMKIFGGDIDPKMVEGSRQNLGEYGMIADLKRADARNIKGCFDAIVTDPPYGRASYACGPAGRLIDDFIVCARKTLDIGSYLVMMTPSEFDIGHDGFKTSGVYDIRIHKSLTRRVWALVRN